MLTGMSKHEEYDIGGYPVDDLGQEPWPPNWTEEEEAKFWHDEQDKYNEKYTTTETSRRTLLGKSR
jgi:hypothetical protein